MLSADRLTVKASEALQNAAHDARRRGNAEVHGAHLLDALLSQDEGTEAGESDRISTLVDQIRRKRGQVE